MRLIDLILRIIIYERSRKWGRPIGSIADDCYPGAPWWREKQGEFDP